MASMRHDPRSDEELVAACNGASADEAVTAFEALYRRHRNYVLRVASRFARHPELAADALQDTFTYLLRQFPPTGPGLTLSAKLTSYLYPIAKNFAISALRKHERLAPTHTEPDSLPGPALSSSADADIDRVLAGLSAERREVLTLRFVDDLPLEEIAVRLGIPLGTVKSRLHFAIKALKDDPRIKSLFEP